MGSLTSEATGTVTVPTAPTSETSTMSAWLMSQLPGNTTVEGEVTEPGFVRNVVVVSLRVGGGPTGVEDTGVGAVVPGVAVTVGEDEGTREVLVAMLVPEAPVTSRPSAEPLALLPKLAAPDPDATGTRSKGANAHLAMKARTVTPSSVRVNR